MKTLIINILIEKMQFKKKFYELLKSSLKESFTCHVWASKGDCKKYLSFFWSP